MYVTKVLFGILIAGSIFTGCEKTKKRTIIVADPKQSEEISQLKKERDELTEKLALYDPKMKEKVEQLEGDLAARDALIKEKDALITAKEKELEEAKKGSNIEEVARLREELDKLRSEKTALEAEYKAAVAGKDALIDAAERDKARLEKLLDYSIEKGIKGRDQLEQALKDDGADAEARVNLLDDYRSRLKEDIAQGAERILQLQQMRAPTVEDMLADKKTLEALPSRTPEQQAKLKNLIDYFDASEAVDAWVFGRQGLELDQEKLEKERDEIAKQLTSVSQDEAQTLDEIVKLSETPGTGPDKMKDLIEKRNALLSQIADLKSRKDTNAKSIQENTKQIDFFNVQLTNAKGQMDAYYDKYQGKPSSETLKEAEEAQNRLLATYKQTDTDLQNAKAALEEIKDLRDFLAKKTVPVEPKAD